MSKLRKIAESQTNIAWDKHKIGTVSKTKVSIGSQVKRVLERKHPRFPSQGLNKPRKNR